MPSVPFDGVHRTSNVPACTAGKLMLVRGFDPSSTMLMVGVLSSSETGAPPAGSVTAEGAVLLALMISDSAAGVALAIAGASLMRKNSSFPFAVLSVSKAIREISWAEPYLMTAPALSVEAAIVTLLSGLSSAA